MIEGVYSLHHSYDNSEAGCDYLVFRHDPISTSDSFSVSFRIRHIYDPSSQNNWQFALLAKFLDEEENAGGYAEIISALIIGVNFVGSDDTIKVWGLEENRAEELLISSINYQEKVGTERSPLFELKWDGEKKLELFMSMAPNEQEPELIGSCWLSSLPWGRDLVLRFKYSSSRDQALWFDELTLDGHFEKDSLAPLVKVVKIIDAQTIHISFSEMVKFPKDLSFRLFSEEALEGISPDTLWMIEDGVMILFQEIIPNRLPLQLLITGVVDLEGNQLKDSVVLLMRNEAQWGDLVFNEVMADPDPEVRYEEEYLELYNRSGYQVDLKGWYLEVNERDYILDVSMLDSELGSESSMVLKPESFALLRGVTLPNDGAVLSLYSPEEKLIHAVSYMAPWNGQDWKKDGGWSLESPDADLVCLISSLWNYSTDPSGGTPGKINSNLEDLTDMDPPLLLFAGLGEQGAYLLHYSEAVRLPDISEVDFILNPGAITLDSMRTIEPQSAVLSLFYPENVTLKQSYRISLPLLSDCEGNLSAEREWSAGAPAVAEGAAMVISEIMYDPDEEYPEFVELYLPGEQYYDLQDFSIHLVEEGRSPENPVALSRCSRLVLPGQYLVLTRSVPHLMDAYGLELTGCWVEVEALPGLNNSGGTVYLTDRAGNVVDMMHYNDAMHMELLDDPRGISLERISWKRPGIEVENWHSAASIEGYATPGRRNSQTLEDAEDSKGRLLVEPEVFSPDNDGFRDYLNISFIPGEHDWVLSIWITDLHGRLVKELANNQLVGNSAELIWDGEGEYGAMQPMGFYVVQVKGYHPPSGEKWIRRKAVGLVYR